MIYGNMGNKRSVLIRQSDLRGLDHFPRTNFRKKAKKQKLQWAKSFVKTKSYFHKPKGGQMN